MIDNCSIIINARVGSTRLPEKIIRCFAGTTLLDIALGKLKNLSYSNKYLAACPSECEIMSIYKKYENDVGFLPRSKESVSKGKKHQTITFKHYLDVSTEYIMMVNSCAPFLRCSTITDAIRVFFLKQAKTMTSVIKEDNIFFDENEVVLNANSYDISTQGNRPISKMVHLFHIFNKDFFSSNGYFWDYTVGNPYLYHVDINEAFDIDYMEEFKLYEHMYKAYISSERDADLL